MTETRDQFRRLAGLTLLLLLLPSACASLVRSPNSPPTGQLPRAVVPTRYTLDLTIDPDASHFSGHVEIALEMSARLRTIWIHAEHLEPTSVTLATDTETLDGAWQDAGDGVVAIELPEEVGPGEASLRIAYTAPFDERLRGLYRVVDNGRAYAFTQFEPLDARHAFPGFDEPSFKTPFEISLTVPTGLVPITNTAAQSSEDLADGRTRTRFHTTVPLPTYLVAFAVGPFDVVDAPPMAPRKSREHTIVLRGIAVRGRGEQLDYALRNTPPLLVAFEDWFDSPLPYEKLDILAVPDFSSGAMENAGAITFRDSLLLFDSSMSARDRRSFTYVMAHELAHTWFGNTVTMPWWNDIWLNEAFATWHGNRIVATIAPEQNAELSLLASIHGAMQVDGRASARAIRQPIESNHDVHNAFDPITYSKGAGVLGMFEHWIGPEKFRAGVRRYIDEHRDGNATTDDLLRALSAASGRNLSAPFQSFLTQPGVPLVTTRLECDAQGARLALMQERYVPLGGTAARDRTWEIPVCARYGSGRDSRRVCGLLTSPRGTLPLPSSTCPQWVLPNADAAGYYRFTQDSSDTIALVERGFPSLTAAERLAVASNLDAAFRAGTSATAIFGTFDVLAADEDRSVNTAPLPLLELARDRLVRTEDLAKLRQLTTSLYAPRFRRLGWDPNKGEDGETALLRRAVVGALAFTAHDPVIRAEAARRAERYAGIDGLGPGDALALSPDLVDVALRVAVEDGGARVFDALQEQLYSSDDAVDRRHRLAALGFASDPTLIARAQAVALDPRLRVNETTGTLWPLSMRVATQGSTWEFIEENFDALVERIGEGGAGKLPWLAAGMCSAEAADRVEAFLRPRATTLSGGPRNVAGAVESVRQCAALVNAQRAGVQTFLAARR